MIAKKYPSAQTIWNEAERCSENIGANKYLRAVINGRNPAAAIRQATNMQPDLPFRFLPWGKLKNYYGHDITHWSKTERKPYGAIIYKYENLAGEIEKVELTQISAAGFQNAIPKRKQFKQHPPNIAGEHTTQTQPSICWLAKTETNNMAIIAEGVKTALAAAEILNKSEMQCGDIIAAGSATNFRNAAEFISHTNFCFWIDNDEASEYAALKNNGFGKIIRAHTSETNSDAEDYLHKHRSEIDIRLKLALAEKYQLTDTFINKYGD